MRQVHFVQQEEIWIPKVASCPQDELQSVGDGPGVPPVDDRRQSVFKTKDGVGTGPIWTNGNDGKSVGAKPLAKRDPEPSLS